jgi:hypothetical protein
MRLLQAGELNRAFGIYWDEMDLCRRAGTYWALLHVTVCLPDICAALQTASGETIGQNATLYKGWCETYLQNPKISCDERYQMRCKVLHQGRASIPGSPRYSGFAFTQPAPTGEVYHEQLDPKGTFVVDVGRLAEETRAGVQRWIAALEGNPTGDAAMNVAKHLHSLVQVRQFEIPPKPGMPRVSFLPTINRTS